LASEVTLTIDGTPVTVPAGTLLVEAAKRVKTDIPVYCYHPKLGPAGLCRICLVDVEKTPKLQIACNTVVAEGMVVHTYGAKVEEGRRAVLEFLLLNHPLDCPICDKGGECDLQDFSMAYGQGASRKIEAKVAKPKAVDLGPTIVLDEERCIVCQRCVRFDDIITGEQSLVVKERGHTDLIATATDDPYVSNFSGNVTELCPVGALTSKTYRFKSRPWDLKRTRTTCTQCSVGCQMNVDVRHGEVLRTMSVEDDDAQSDGWLCDRGRYNVGYLSDSRRIASPLLRDGDGWTQIAWEDAIALWATRIKEAIAQGGPSAVGAVGGGRLLSEEAYLLQHLFRALGVENLDWRAGRQSKATPGRDVSGSYEALERAQTIVILGRPPSQMAPVMDLRIRKAVTRHGARVFAVGAHPARSFVAAQHVASVDDIPADAIDVERIAVIYDGANQPLLEAANARFAPLHAAGKLAGYIAGEQPNARGAEAMGMLPNDGALGTREMFEAARGGSLRVLSLFGVNPALRYGDGALAAAALAAVPFLVVSDLFLTETALHASLVLPARAGLEKDGHILDLTGTPLAVNAGVTPPAGTLSDGEMLVALAAELGVAIPSPTELADAALSTTRGPIVANAASALAPPATLSGLHVAIAEHSFGGGGTARFDDRLGELRPQATVRVSAQTALGNGLDDGDLVDLVAGDRTLTDMRVRLDGEAPPDTLTVVDAISGVRANVLADGEAIGVKNVRKARPGVAGTV
jgi:NADH-quinone oxidoreductase subunit G